MSGSSPSSSDAFEAVAFLAGSPNRVAVLDALATTGPCSRPELVDAVGASRVTVGRILDDFLGRGWVVRTGQRYEHTPVGEVVRETFESALRTVESMNHLSAVQQWLPTDFDVDARRLTSARITVPTWSDSVAPVRRAADLCYGLERLRVCASGVAPDVIQGIRDAAVDGDAVVEVVFTDEALDVVRGDSTMRDWFAELLGAGGRLYEHPGHPYLIATCDQTAVVGVNDGSGAPRGLLESSDLAVLEWVETTIDRCREEATTVDTAAFTP